MSWSEELHTTYDVIEKNGDLKLQHYRHGTLNLSNAWGDDFEGSRWFINSVEFYRDNKGKIEGFKVTQGRARNQVFEKVKSKKYKDIPSRPVKISV